MDTALIQLQELATAAIAHAEHAHGISLRLGDFAKADHILHRERSRPDPTDLEMVAACYGAWLGQSAIEKLDARWTGLYEAQSPRLCVGGVICSPIDAVKRFLTSSQSLLDIAEMASRMHQWAESYRTSVDPLPHNEKAWDQLASDVRFAGEMPLPPDSTNALAALDPWLTESWLPGMKILCLGAGGGRQGPLHAIAGADVTVVDISQRQLDHDKAVADRHGLKMTLIRASADRLQGIKDKSFDAVVQPVSSCYLHNIQAMYEEVSRVLKPKGIYLVQHKQPFSLLVNESSQRQLVIDQPSVEGQSLPTITRSEQWRYPSREPGVIEYAHSLQTLIGDLCSAGFVIAKFAEPPRADAFAPAGSAEHRACFMAPYMKIKAICC